MCFQTLVESLTEDTPWFVARVPVFLFVPFGRQPPPLQKGPKKGKPTRAADKFVSSFLVLLSAAVSGRCGSKQ